MSARVAITPECHERLKRVKDAEDKTFDALLRTMLEEYDSGTGGNDSQDAL